MEIWEAGALVYLMRTYTPMMPQCSTLPKSNTISSHQIAIKMKDLKGGFLLLGTGLGLAFLVFLIEWIVYGINRKPKQFTLVHTIGVGFAVSRQSRLLKRIIRQKASQ